MDDETDGTTGDANETETSFADDEAAFREKFIRGELTDDDETDAKAKPDKGGKPKIEASSEARDGSGDEDADEDERDEDEDELDLDEPDEDDADDEKPLAAAGADKDDKDPELAKRLAQLKRAEQRNREQLNRDRAAFEHERDQLVAEWKPRIEAAQEFERLRSRAASDPAGVLMALGVAEDDFEEVSKILYGMSKAGAADPKNKAAAAALRRERELRQRLEASESGLAELKQQLAARDEESQASQRVGDYLARVEKAATDDTPLLKKSLELSPNATRAKLQELAYRMANKNGGEAVSPREVARAFEKRRRAVLERDLPLGELLKPKGKDKAGSIRVEDRSAGRSSSGGSARNGSTNGTRYLTDAEMIQRLREGKLDDADLD